MTIEIIKSYLIALKNKHIDFIREQADFLAW